MTVRPILFQVDMVRAIIGAHKSQTRRVLTKSTPNYQIGDLLYVREGFQYDTLDIDRDGSFPCWYNADGEPTTDNWGPKKPSIHMPKRYSRLTLKIKHVRRQLLQEITPDDALAEGIDPVVECCGRMTSHQTGETHGWPDGYEECCGNPEIAEDPRITFARLWDSINDARGHGWQVNPQVVALTFETHRWNVEKML